MNLHEFEELRRNVKALHDRALSLSKLRPGRAPAGITAFGVPAPAFEPARARSQPQHPLGLHPTRLALDVEHDHYRDLFELAPVAYVVTDSKGIVLELNRAAAALFQSSARFVLGKPLAGFITLEQRPEFRRELVRLCRKTGPAALQHRITLLGGHSFQATLLAAVEYREDGQPASIRWVITPTPTTERAGAAEAARPRPSPEDFYPGHIRNLVDNVDAILWEADGLTGRFTYVSRAAETMLGYAPGRWLTDNDFGLQIIHPADRDWVASGRARAARDCRDADLEYRIQSADGRLVWVRDTIRACSDPTSGACLLRGIIINVTKRKKVERQLYVAKRQVATQLSDLTYLQELGGRLPTNLEMGPLLEEVLAAVISIQSTSLGMLLVFDRERNAFLPAAVTGFADELVPLVPSLPCGEGVSHASLARGEPISVRDMEAEPACGPLLPLLRRAGVRALHSTPLLAHDGQVLGAIMVFFQEPHTPAPNVVRLVDLYARQAEHFIESARLLDDARAEARRNDRLLATVAHELRGPLGAISSASLLLTNLPDPDQAEAVGLLRRQVGHLERLIADLMETARAAQGKIILKLEDVDLADIVARTLEITRTDIKSRGHTLAVSLPPERIPLKADPTRLIQAIGNLLANAAKYTPPPGRIELDVAAHNGQAILTVRDTGVGIAPQDLAHVFEPFAQARPASGHAEGGLGLGLALVRSLIELHGGTVSASSPGEGRGSVFTVRLPLSAAAPPATHGAMPAADPSREAPGPARRILVVDDHQVSARLLARLLKLEGHEVHIAHDGPSAIAAAEDEHPDVILLDVNLPGMSGYEVARYLREQADAEPDADRPLLIALTGLVEGAGEVQVGPAAFDHHLLKPVDMNSLRAMLESSSGRPAQA